MKKLFSGNSDLKLPILLFTIILFSLSSNAVLGQTDVEISKEYQITLTDGNMVTGKVLSASSTEIVIQTSNMGDITIKRENIRSLVLLSSKDAQKRWFPNPNTTRYYFGPTGRNLKKGEGYFQNVLLTTNLAHYGITDFFSIGGGFEFISLFSGHPVIILTPKVGFDISNNFSVGGGLFYVNIAALADDLSGSGGGIAYGAATVGNDNTHGTLGLGWFFGGGEAASSPVVTISGAARLSKRFGLVTENWILPKLGLFEDEKNIFVITYGVRFIGERSTFDWGVIAFNDVGETGFPIGLPIWISYSFHF